MKPERSLACLIRYLFMPLRILALLVCFGVWVLPASAQTQSPSFVRVLHASPFVGTADVFVDGNLLLSSFQFGAVTDYASVAAGPHKVQIALVGKGIGASALSQELAVKPGVAYTVAAVGADAKSLALQVFVDNNIITPGTAKVRIYQLSPNIGSVNLTTQAGTLTTGVNYLECSDYLPLSQSSATFQVVAPQVNATLSADASLNEKVITSIFVVGMYKGTPTLELVVTHTNGVPGVPGTGSDPNALPTNSQPSQPLNPWLFVALLLFIGTGVLGRRLARTR